MVQSRGVRAGTELVKLAPWGLPALAAGKHGWMHMMSYLLLLLFCYHAVACPPLALVVGACSGLLFCASLFVLFAEERKPILASLAFLCLSSRALRTGEEAYSCLIPADTLTAA